MHADQRRLEDNLIHRINVGDALRRSAARYPGNRAVHCAGRDVTYAELDALANRMARSLQARGVGRGDAVAIRAPNSPEFLAAFFACARIGAPLVPLNLLSTAEDHAYIIEKAKVKVTLSGLTDPGGDSSPVEEYVASDDIAAILFTSGTTARPKGVVLTHQNWYMMLLSLTADSGLDRRFRFFLGLPMFHVSGLGIAFSAVFLGAEGFIPANLKAETILETVVGHRINTMSLPATLWVALQQAPGIESADLSCLRKVVVFQYLPTSVYERWRQLAPNADWLNYWGQTETSALGSACPPEDLWRKLTAPDPIGRPHLPVELRLVDDEMRDVPPGQPGEIVLRGPSIAAGYLDDPEATEALFRGGWHHTGDVAYRDEEGCLYFLDRKKDMIKSGGENVSSQEVEEALARHPAVAEVAVVGVPDPYWIEKVVAAVTLAPGAQATEETLIQHARSRLAGFKVPKQIFILTEFPKTASGKILKRDLRLALAQKTTAQSA
jgi:fatty-acyl-CoA synthase